VTLLSNRRIAELSPSLQLGKWIHNWRVDPSARFRLFCFPYAGGNASVYRPWQEALTRAGIEVCPLELPGRLARLREAPFSELETMVETLARVLRPILSEPFAFFGYSMGALVAFELARYLRRTGAPTPERLLVAARPAPQLPPRGRALHDLSDEALLAEIAGLYGALPEAVLADVAFRAIVVDVLRNDLALLSRYRYREESALGYPIVAFGGRDDPSVSTDELAAWRAHASEFTLELFDGGHFFLNANRTRILEEVRRALEPLITRGAVTA